mgnify:CR=1 FL=1
MHLFHGFFLLIPVHEFMQVRWKNTPPECCLTLIKLQTHWMVEVGRDFWRSLGPTPYFPPAGIFYILQDYLFFFFFISAHFKAEAQCTPDLPVIMWGIFTPVHNVSAPSCSRESPLILHSLLHEAIISKGNRWETAIISTRHSFLSLCLPETGETDILL